MNATNTTANLNEQTTTPDPAQDRVTETEMITKLEEKELERVIPAEDLVAMRDEYKDDTRFGERWTMQKAICLLLTDYPATLTLLELAYIIDQWFNKPNYGLGRAVVDMRKFKGHKFACQSVDESTEDAA